MPDGEMRRPPQLWEQRLARTTSILGVGVTSGDASAIVEPAPAPGVSTGFDASPVLPPVGDFIDPSTPTLIGGVQGINVLWDGLNSAGDLWPYDTSFVEVHMDTSSGTFTPGTATLKGRLARPGSLFVGGLTAGTTYYFRLRGADPAGNVTTASTATSGAAGSAVAADIAAGAVTADKLTAGTISGFYISGGTIDGGVIRTSASGERITMADATATYGADSLNLIHASGTAGIFYPSSTFGVVLDGKLWISETLFVNQTITTTGNVTVNAKVICDDLEADRVLPESNAIVINGYRTSTTAGDVMFRLRSDVTNPAEAKFEVDADGDVKSRTNSYAGFSDARLKDNIEAARDYLEDLRQVDVVTFNWQGSDQKLLGVTAQQIQPIFPSMVAEDEDGTLSVRYSVFVPMLITAVQSLADKVDDLTARIEALEA